MFSAKHSFVDMKECTLIKNKNFTKIGGGLPECKKVFFFVTFLVFGGFVFFFSVFLCFCFVQNSPKWLFPAFLEVFCLFCSHKRPVLKCFFSSYFVFFAFVFLFKNPFLYFLFVHQPLFNKRLFVGFLFFFFFLPFFLNVCLFLSNKLS